MKKICFRYLILFALLSLLAACEEGGGAYYVSFEADGTPVILTEGAVPGGTYHEQAVGMMAKGSGFVIYASEEGNSDHVISPDFYGITTGKYLLPDCDCTYWTAYPTYYGSDFAPNPDPFTITVTEIGEVGGVITGTFSGTLQKQGDVTEMTITNGEFRVLRID